MRYNKYERHGAYHWNQYNLNRKYKTHADRVKDWVKEKKVLDVGAGDGLITSLLGAKGIEFEPEGVRLAQERGVDVIQGDAYELPFENNSFEAVTMIDVLEHLENPKKALQEARRVAPILYIQTPIIHDDRLIHKRYHVTEWSPLGLCELVESEGYILDGAITIYPHTRMQYAKFI
jgi:SAM-dependent methyltransferase